MLGFKELTDEEKAVKERRAIVCNRVLDILFLIPAVLMTVLFMVAVIMVGAGVVRSVLWGVWAALLLSFVIKGRKNGFFLMIIAGLFVTFWLFIIAGIPGGFSSRSPWKYRSQVKYVDLMHNGHSDCFPDELPEDISDYSIEYMPSMMQGTGHFRVRFRTSAQQLEEYEKMYSAQELYTIPLEDFGGNFSVGVKEFAPGAEYKFENDKSLDVAYNQEFWEGHDKDATVYVVSAVHNWNHPHSGAVIINKSEGMVEFTHLG